MKTKADHWLKAGIVILLAFMLAVSLGHSQAEAQERRTLFQLLFGAKPRPEPQVPIWDQPVKQVRPKPRKKATPAPADTTPVIPAVEKAADARRILVIGDFLASGLGDGLNTTFASAADIAVETRGQVASGLVREDHYNWQEKLPAALDEIKPAMVVVMIGANDRQQMVVNGTREKFRTQEWLDEYAARAAKLAGTVRGRNIPLVWVGLPAFQSPSMTADAVQFNGIYRAAVEKAGGEFIDIWDGFVDANGKFVITGSDVNGQQVRLRGSDGVNLTKAGRLKVAFYAEKSVKRLLGGAEPEHLVRLDAGNLPELLDLPPAEQVKITRTPPISLMDPELDGGKELLGAAPARPAADTSARTLLVERGEVETPPAGRIDDYRVTK